MTRCLKRKSSRRGPGLIRSCELLTGLLLLMPMASNLVAQDDYLQALESEAPKIDPLSTSQSDARTADTPAVQGQNQQSASGVSREQFESLLQQEYRGTYVFYRQLQTHTQEEIFSEYEKGVPIADLRDKVVERYLQR
mgnify:CR=1 FL=1